MYNNPILYTDPSGNIPTVRVAAEMAHDIYHVTDENYGKQLLGGWKLFAIKTNEESLRIGVYYRTNDEGISEFALVNKGSSTRGDWVNNFQQPLGYSDDMKDSIAFAVAFVKGFYEYEVTMRKVDQHIANHQMGAVKKALEEAGY